MDKNAIKKYAVWTRNELIARVTQKAEQYEITEKKTSPADADSIGGRLLTDAEKKQRAALIEKIKVDGFEQVMEEVAYTWFDRFTALRFMEVNNYLPSHTRVFTNEAGEFKPQILADAIQLELDGLDMDKVFELKDANKTEELYKYLLIVQCNALSSILPRMFQKIEHYTELLLPDYLLREGSVIEQMIALIPEEDWTDQVQIIGWLYQFYNIEPKAKAISKQRGLKITKEELPAATQLFTPDWIVRYMVENSLGRLWLEGHPNKTLQSEWKYYLDEAEQEDSAQKKLDEIRKEYAALKPEEIRCIDPCMGSGHILCYMFDVLVKIYEDYGYSAREAVGNIVEKNLWGLDIDDRAAQLSYFAVMMKARQYDRRFFTRDIQPNVFAIEESNGITSAPMHDMGVELSEAEYSEAVKQAMRLVEELHDAKEYGSLIHVTPCDWELLKRFAIPRCVSEGQLRLDIHGEINASERLQSLIRIGEALSQNYDTVVTNPPYLGVSDFSAKLGDYVKKKYPDSKADLFSAFIERCASMAKKNKYYSMITMHSWMFLSSFEALRLKMETADFVNMAHLGAHAFEEIGGEVVQTASFVVRKSYVDDYKGVYVRLLDEGSQDAKEIAFLSGKNRYVSSQGKFRLIPGAPVAYWVRKELLDAFENGTVMEKIAEIVTGMSTGNNDSYLRLWPELDINSIAFYKSSFDDVDLGVTKWIPYNKGGEARKWYGNNDYVVKWSESAHFHRARPTFSHLYLKQGITWSFVTSGMFSARYYPDGFLWDVAGCPCVIHDEDLMYYALGYLSTKIANQILKIINPTINCQVVDVQRTPIIIDEGRKAEVISLAKECIETSKSDWDSFETSWDFTRHPIVPLSKERQEQEMSQFANSRMEKFGKIAWHFERWQEVCESRFANIKGNEERLNEIFMDIFQIHEGMTSEVDEKDVTVRRADEEREVKSLISYAVGCMFGRYSLDCPGIVYAGGDWNEKQYKSFLPDKDAIIPICDDEYFEDDIVGRFIKFVETAYGCESLEDNLKYIADRLGGKGTSREIIRSYFMNDFYNDHLKMYQKRPIYWMFDSGKKNGFKCLIYMHRYRPDTIARIRTDYVHEQQSRYRTAIAEIEQRTSSSSGADKISMNKRLQVLRDQSEELRAYEEKIHHLADQMIQINLDDGIKTNYDKFKDVLAKVK